jgi:hypothetical protein
MRIAAGALLFALAAVDISFSDAIHAGNSASLLSSTSRLPLRHPGWISDIRGGSTGKLFTVFFRQQILFPSTVSWLKTSFFVTQS